MLREQDLSKEYFSIIERQGDNIELCGKLLKIMKTLWADGGIQESFKRSREYQLNDSAGQ